MMRFVRSGLDEEGSDVGAVVLMEEVEEVCLRVQMFGMGWRFFCLMIGSLN